MTRFALTLILFLGLIPLASAAETSTEQKPPDNSARATEGRPYDLSAYPSADLPESTSIKPYTLTQHRYTQEGSLYHPAPPKTEETVQVDEQGKVVKVVGKHELSVFKNWAEEKYFDAKFEGLDKRFDAIEKRQTDLDRRLAKLEKK